MTNDKKSFIDKPSEKAAVDIVNGAKKPETKEEKELKEDIDEIKKKGGVVDIPSDI